MWTSSRKAARIEKLKLLRYRGDPNPFEWLESFAELESLIKEAGAG